MRNTFYEDYVYLNDVAFDGGGVDDATSASASAAAVDGAAGTSFPIEISADNSTTALGQFSYWYQGFHGYVSVAWCIFGIVSNAMNILVLTRKSMISPTNNILTALAIADLLTMVSYLPYAFYFYCVTVPDERYGHAMGWVIYLMFNTYFTITTHTAAMWLTVSLAVFRYLVICCQPAVGATLCSLRRAKITIIAVFVATPIFCIPHYVKYRIHRRPSDAPIFSDSTDSTVGPTAPTSDVNWVVESRNDDDAEVVTSSSELWPDRGYWFADAELITPTMNTVNYWVFGVVLKVVPCVLLAALSWLLVRAMKDAADKRRRLLSAGRRDESERAGEHMRTTAMLVAVVLCFLATELPQGVLALLSGVIDGVFENVYVPLADVFDLLVLVNSAVNFVLYCSMSRQFRRTFGELFIDSTCVGRKKKGAATNGKHQSAGRSRGASTVPAGSSAVVSTA